jgi:hypothetical protein
MKNCQPSARSKVSGILPVDQPGGARSALPGRRPGNEALWGRAHNFAVQLPCKNRKSDYLFPGPQKRGALIEARGDKEKGGEKNSYLESPVTP